MCRILGLVREHSNEGREGEGAYISGSFCVSITAAMGIPKLETGPQKSIPWRTLAIYLVFKVLSLRAWFLFSFLSRSCFHVTSVSFGAAESALQESQVARAISPCSVCAEERGKDSWLSWPSITGALVTYVLSRHSRGLCWSESSH